MKPDEDRPLVKILRQLDDTHGADLKLDQMSVNSLYTARTRLRIILKLVETGIHKRKGKKNT